VLDSLHNERLAGAEVHVTGVARTIRTDSAGLFELDSVKPGTYEITATHPVADSLGIAMKATVPVTGNQDVGVILAIPGIETTRRLFCEDSTSPGFIRGRISRSGGGAVTKANVTLSWLALDSKPEGTSALIPSQVTTTSDEYGYYSFCGLPNDFEGSLQAALQGDSTALIPVSLAWSPIAIVARPLSLPVQNARATISGRVADSSGRALSGATIDVIGKRISTRSRDDGTFTLSGAPTGTQIIRVRKVGYSAGMNVVEVESPGTSHLAITLDNPIPRLATVIVRGMLSDVGDRTGFTRRALAGPGRYVTPADLEKRQSRCVLDAMRSSLMPLPKGFGCSIRWSASMSYRGLSSLPGVQPITGNRGEALKMPAPTVESSSCLVVYIDDLPEQPDLNDEIELSWLDPREVAGIEYYSPATSPVRTGSGRCNTLFIWTLAYHGAHH
jgi:hypothetical protein